VAALTIQQIQFLDKHRVPLSRVFDATGMSTKHSQKIMKDLGMLVAFGVSPCAKAAHTLRTRVGHCAQCDTSKLAYLLRHEGDAMVYVAYSRRARLVKIGSAVDASSRMRTLNSRGYGGSDDWTLINHWHCVKAGQIEFRAHKALRTHQARGIYTKSGGEFEYRELFECEPNDAVAAVTAAIGRIGARIFHPSGIVFNRKVPTAPAKPKRSKNKATSTNKTGARSAEFTAKMLAERLGIKEHLVTKTLVSMKILVTAEQPFKKFTASRVCRELGFTLGGRRNSDIDRSTSDQ
jgi:hypothetical protein